MKRIASPAEIALTATAVLITGGTAFFLTTRKGSVITGTYANPLPVPSSDAAAKRVPAVAERLRRLWPEVTGDGEMPPQALEIALAQAWLESGVAEAGGGGWWTDKTAKGQGNMVGSGNLGARQCGGNDHGGSYYDCVAYGDTIPQPDGSSKPIDANFMYFKAGKTPDGKDRDAGDAAAWRFLTDITKTWPALAELKSGDVMAYAKRQGPKSQGGNGYYQGFGATMDERVAGYARAIASHIPAVAAALGHKKVYAKIEPDLLASGPKHAPATAGVRLSGAEIARAMHAAGALPRARAIPGSRGHVVWYIERPDLGAAHPRDVMISEEDAAAQDIAVRAASRKDQPDVEGVAAVVLSIIAGILVASGIAAAHAVGKARELLGKLRGAGYDIAERQFDATKGLWAYVPKSGWLIVDASDPAFAKIRQLFGENVFDRMLGAGVKFQRPATVSGYSSRWARRIPVGDLVEDILKTGTTVLETVEKNIPPPKKEESAPATPAAPASATASTPPQTIPPTVATAAVAAGAATAVLLAVSLAWRIAKPRRLGEAEDTNRYPAFLWMNELPSDIVSTLRAGGPLDEIQVRRLTPAQSQTIVDHALLVSRDGIPDPATWYLGGDDRAPLGGVTEAVQAASVATIGVVALVGAIALYRFLPEGSGESVRKGVDAASQFVGIAPNKEELSRDGVKCITKYGFMSVDKRCGPPSPPADWTHWNRSQRLRWAIDNYAPVPMLDALKMSSTVDGALVDEAIETAGVHLGREIGDPTLPELADQWRAVLKWYADKLGPNADEKAREFLSKYVPFSGVEKRESRWIRWLLGDAQAGAGSAKKVVDDIAEKYGSDNAAKVVKSTTGGVLTGLAIGAALGTAFPGLGNVVGAAIGAIVGALAGLMSGLLGLGPTAAQIALAEEVNKFNRQVHDALAKVPADARLKIGNLLLDAMRKTPGNLAICVGPGADSSDIGCVMTGIDGVRDAAVHLDENVQRWILQYEAEVQAAKTKRYKRVAAVTGGITLAALAAVAIAVKTGFVAIGDAGPKYPTFSWMAGFPPDVVAILRGGAPLDAATLSRLNRNQRRILAAHAALDMKNGVVDLASWRLVG